MRGSLNSAISSDDDNNEADDAAVDDAPRVAPPPLPPPEQQRRKSLADYLSVEPREPQHHERQPSWAPGFDPATPASSWTPDFTEKAAESLAAAIPTRHDTVPHPDIEIDDVEPDETAGFTPTFGSSSEDLAATFRPRAATPAPTPAPESATPAPFAWPAAEPDLPTKVSDLRTPAATPTLRPVPPRPVDADALRAEKAKTRDAENRVAQVVAENDQLQTLVATLREQVAADSMRKAELEEKIVMRESFLHEQNDALKARNTLIAELRAELDARVKDLNDLRAARGGRKAMAVTVAAMTTEIETLKQIIGNRDATIEDLTEQRNALRKPMRPLRVERPAQDKQPAKVPQRRRSAPLKATRTASNGSGRKPAPEDL